MKRALEMLGFNPCYHMYEVMPNKGHYDHWLSIYNDRADPNWNETFKDYSATVDWPAQAYWRELADHYPDAKILLTVRSSESWFASMDKTIRPMLLDPEAHPGLAKSIGRRVFGGRFDRDSMIAAFERNIAEVQASFGPDRLLTYELGSGWDPLCTFLGVDVPNVPYPSGNQADEFHRRDKELTAMRKDTES
jgi:hypothetical protein